MATVPNKVAERLVAGLKRFQPVLLAAKSRDVGESDTVTIIMDMLAEIDLPVKLDDSRVFLRSAEPPSWISLIAQSDWWVNGLAACAALYVAKIVKEAAKDSWKNKGKAVTAVVGASNKLWRLASSLFNAKAKSRANTYIAIGLPVPDDVYTTLLQTQSTEPDDLAMEVALFVHYVPALVQLLDDAGIPEGSAVGGLRQNFSQMAPFRSSGWIRSLLKRASCTSAPALTRR